MLVSLRPVVPNPDVSVVVATRDRHDRLNDLLASLRRQTLDPARFEVIFVDDASVDDTPRLLAQAAEQEPFAVRVISREVSEGPSAARDDGWREARAPLVAFTDDDCVVDEQWLERATAAAQAHPGAVIQGAVGPIPREAHRLSPFARTIVVDGPGPPWETCNIFYPRDVLEAIDGFDRERFPLPGGEDTDLAWRAQKRGAKAVFDPSIKAWHAVIVAGPLGMLRYAWHWERTVPVFAIHPDLRRSQLHRGVFWSPTHEHLVRALVAIPLARRSWPLALLLAWPYVRRLTWRRSGPLLAPFILATDLVELAAMLRGALRDRVLVI